MSAARITRPCVAIDARMIEHSGIGVMLQNLLIHWEQHPPGFDMLLLGNRGKIWRSAPPSYRDRFVHWDPEIYSLRAMLLPPRLPDATIWYSPHYATCVRPGRKLVCHIQDILHITHPGSPAHSIFMRTHLALLRRRAAFVLATSRHVKVQLQTQYRFNAARVLCTGLGPGEVDPTQDYVAPLPEELGGRPYLLALGIYKSHKNWDFLLAQLRELRGKIPIIACLGLGDGIDRFLAKARKFGVEDCVLPLPRIDRYALGALYRQAHGLVYPSVAEGFGLPVLEAMSLGVPVLIADRSPMKDITGDGAFTFDPDWPETFRESCLAFVHDEPMRKTLAAKARQRAKDFSWAKTAGIIEQAFHRAVE